MHISMKKQCPKCNNKLTGFSLLGKVIMNKKNHFLCSHCGGKIEIENKHKYYMITFILVISILLISGNLYFNLIEVSLLKGTIFALTCSAICYLILSLILPHFMTVRVSKEEQSDTSKKE